MTRNAGSSHWFVTSDHEYMSILWLCFVNGQAIGVWGEDGQA